MAYKLNIFTKKFDIDTMQSLTTLDSRYVNVTGDTMTGNLVLNDNVSVLLGTGSDGELFHDGSNTYFQNNTGNIIIENDTLDGDITFKVNDGGVDTTVMTLDGATGNVCIGTTSPSGRLHINGTVDDQQLIVEAHSTQTNNIVEIHDSSSNVLISFNGVGGAIFNEQGSATADFRVEGDTDTNLIFVDASADTVGIGTTSTTAKLNIGGTVTSTGNFTVDSAGSAFYIIDRGATTNFGGFQFKTAGVDKASIGTRNDSTENIYINLDSADEGRRRALIFKPNSESVFNDEGGNMNFRVESDTEENMLFVDADGDTDGALYLGGSTNGIKVKKGGVLTFLGTANISGGATGSFTTTDGKTVTVTGGIITAIV